MNKQEAIKELKAKKDKNEKLFELEDWDAGFKCGAGEALDDAIFIVKQLDEPEKPVVPEFVDEYIQKRRRFSKKLYDALRYSNTTLEIDDWLIESNNAEVFAKAWIYGYEVEKEKLYTAKLKLTNEYLHYDKGYKKFHHYAVHEDWANKKEEFHFTEDVLTKYNAWGNNAYEVKEVEE